MLAKSYVLAAVVACAALLAPVPAPAQLGHPVKGSWLGYWGPNPETQRRIVLLLDWDNREVVGTINPGKKAVKITRASLDYSTWTLTLEADMPNAAGRNDLWVATGKMENLGSWNNRRYSGTYRHGAEAGKFSVTLH